MIKDNAELPDEILSGISDNPILLPWLREVQSSVIEYDKSQQFAFKSGPASFVSPYINSWARGYSTDNSLYDATGSANGIYVREEGIYEIYGCQGSNGTGGGFSVLASNGSRTALENTADSLYIHDRSPSLNNYATAYYIGFVASDTLITLGPPDATVSSYLLYSSNETSGSIRVRRVSSI